MSTATTGENNKKRKRFRSSKEMVAEAELLAPEVLAFVWEKECWEGETKEGARGAHFDRLLRTHGQTFVSYKEHASGNKTPMPSKQQIFTLPIFTNPVTGPNKIACIQDSYRPAVFQTQKKKNQKLT
jgi:hypothetical protein